MSNFFVTGGQVSLHALRMLKQVIATIIKWSLVLLVALTIYFCFLKLSLYHLKVLYWISLAEIADILGNHKYLVKVTIQYGSYSLTPKAVLSNSHFLSIQKYVVYTFFKSLFYSVLTVLISTVMLCIFFLWRGKRLSQDEEVRGNRIASQNELRTLIKQNNSKEKVQSYSLATIPYPAYAENLHTLIAGSTGAGKTVLISNLIKQIKKRGDRAIIYDKMGVYTERFYEAGKDTLLNPFDQRSASWSIFKEVQHEANFDSIASAFIPIEKTSSDPFWTKAARTIFSEVCIVI